MAVCHLFISYIVTVLLDLLRALVRRPVAQPFLQSCHGRDLQQRGHVSDVTKEILVCENMGTIVSVVATAPAATPRTVCGPSLIPAASCGGKSSTPTRLGAHRPTRPGPAVLFARRPSRGLCGPAHGAHGRSPHCVRFFPLPLDLLCTKLVSGFYL